MYTRSSKVMTVLRRQTSESVEVVETMDHGEERWATLERGAWHAGLCGNSDKQPATLLVLQLPSSTAATNDSVLLSPVMAGGVALSEDARGVVIHMKDNCFLDAKTIAYLSGIPIRTVYHILAVWKKTGEVKPAPEGKQGRPRALDFGDTQVSVHTSHGDSLTTSHSS